MQFLGPLFETSPTLAKIKNYFLDFYKQNQPDQNLLSLEGISHVISLTAESTFNDDGLEVFFIHWRVYGVKLMKSGCKLPRVELEEMGPAMVLKVGRCQFATEELWKVATKIPKELKVIYNLLPFSYFV